jgi:MobA/VirD2-like, nuclease domain
VIGKIIEPRGERVQGLIYYLFGPGRANEHTDPHLVAGWRHPAELEPPLRPDGRRDFRRLNGLLAQPHAALGRHGFKRPVWHCVASAAPGDRVLSDDEWAQVAGEIMHRTGLSPCGQDDDGVRWVAIRHAGNHIHIVAMLARQDGRNPRLSYERYRVRAACRAAEERFGLVRTAPGDQTAARRPTRAENEKARRHGRREPTRAALRRHVVTAAASAASEPEFFARLRQAGVLVRLRFSARNPGQVTGYAVALPDATTASGTPVWYGGGKLAADLTLPKLRARWRDPRATPAGPFTPGERAAIWEQATRAAAGAAAQIRSLTGTDPAAAADAAWAASDTLHVAAAALRSRVIRQAADAYDRAARAPYGRIPRRTPAGDSLRHAARLLSAAAFVTGEPVLTATALIARLAALADAVTGLRQAQQRAAQAAAAKTAAERLRAAASSPAMASPFGQAPVPTAAGLAQESFPAPPPSPGPPRPAPRTRRPHPPGARPPRRPRPPAPRGPGR